MATCRKCGKGPRPLDIKGWLERVNPTGIDGVWECRPSCDADLPPDERVVGAIEGDQLNRDAARRQEGTMSEAKLKALAEKTAKYLMTSGDPRTKEVAARLVLTSHDGRDMGGWGLHPLRDVILNALREAVKPTPKRRRSA